MNKTRLFFISAAVAAVLAIGAAFLLLRSDDTLDEIDRVRRHPPASRTVDENEVARLVEVMNEEGSPRFSDDLTFEQMVAVLRANYGKNIKNRWVQIRLIEDLIRSMKARFGEAWIEEMYVTLKAAFPDLADDIFERFEKYQQYQEWLEKNRDELAGMSRDERQEILNEKRNELFGEEVAAEIWAGEIRNEKIATSLKQIDQSGGDLNQKLSSYKAALNEALGEQTDRHMEARRYELTSRFLELPSVQKELSHMSPDDRNDTLTQIRKGLGMDVEAIERWKSLDTERDDRWKTGQSYMSARDALTSGGASESDLNELRLKYFGPDQAEVIKNEEESGFFRYKQERVYGKN